MHNIKLVFVQEKINLKDTDSDNYLKIQKKYIFQKISRPQSPSPIIGTFVTNIHI